MMYRCVVNALIHCAKRLGNNFGKEKIMKSYLIWLFISIRRTSQYGASVPCHAWRNYQDGIQKHEALTDIPIYEIGNKTCTVKMKFLSKTEQTSFLLDKCLKDASSFPKDCNSSQTWYTDLAVENFLLYGPIWSP